MGSGGVAIAALPTVICLKVPFSDGLGGGIFGLNPSIENIDLYLPKNLEVMEFDENQYIWKPTGESYFASPDVDNGIFLGYQFNSVKSW